MLRQHVGQLLLPALPPMAPWSFCLSSSLHEMPDASTTSFSLPCPPLPKVSNLSLPLHPSGLQSSTLSHPPRSLTLPSLPHSSIACSPLSLQVSPLPYIPHPSSRSSILPMVWIRDRDWGLYTGPDRSLEHRNVLKTVQ